MAYEKIGWKDYPDKTTPMNAKNFSHMDDGIFENSVAIGDVSTIASIGDGTCAGAIASCADAIESCTDAIESCFQSVSEGKSLVASAITDKGVETAEDATFETMAENITSIFSSLLLVNSTGISQYGTITLNGTFPCTLTATQKGVMIGMVGAGGGAATTFSSSCTKNGVAQSAKATMGLSWLYAVEVEEGDIVTLNAIASSGSTTYTAYPRIQSILAFFSH